MFLGFHDVSYATLQTLLFKRKAELYSAFYSVVIGQCCSPGGFISLTSCVCQRFRYSLNSRAVHGSVRV